MDRNRMELFNHTLYIFILYMVYLFITVQLNEKKNWMEDQIWKQQIKIKKLNKKLNKKSNLVWVFFRWLLWLLRRIVDNSHNLGQIDGKLLSIWYKLIQIDVLLFRLKIFVFDCFELIFCERIDLNCFVLCKLTKLSLNL